MVMADRIERSKIELYEQIVKAIVGAR